MTESEFELVLLFAANDEIWRQQAQYSDNQKRRMLDMLLSRKLYLESEGYISTLSLLKSTFWDYILQEDRLVVLVDKMIQDSRLKGLTLNDLFEIMTKPHKDQDLIKLKTYDFMLDPSPETHSSFFRQLSNESPHILKQILPKLLKYLRHFQRRPKTPDFDIVIHSCLVAYEYSSQAQGRISYFLTRPRGF